MNTFEAYLSRFLPIFIGIGIMFLLRLANVSRHTVRIETSNDFSAVGTVQEEQDSEDDLHDDTLKSAFAREATDRLIVGGHLSKNTGHRNIDSLAFLDLGMITLENLENIKRPVHNKGLTVVAKDYDEFAASMHSFCKTSGILLAYMVEYRLSLCLMSK